MKSSRVRAAATNEPQLRTGLGGNVYVYCLQRDPVLQVARAIGRAPSSVYWKAEHGVWALRIRDPKHKALVKAHFDRPGGQPSLEVSS